MINVLFAGPPTTGILVDHWGIDERSLLYALLHPKIGLDMFISRALMCLDKVVKYVCIRIRQDNARRLRRRMWIATGMLKRQRIRRFKINRHQPIVPIDYFQKQGNARTIILELNACLAFGFAMLACMCIRIGAPFSTNICFRSIPAILHASMYE